ncbi:hypothetical protein ACQ4PT_046508 [Festuca glaucescens]
MDWAALAYTAAALLCAAAATVIALGHIYRHLLHYAEPIFQRFIVRIIFMVPVYAVMSFISLILPDNAIYFTSIREMYDAWVIYNFFSLCLAWVGGPGAVVVSLNGKTLKPSWFLMTCCFPAIPLDGRFIRRCKQGCLQFVILKPILVVITFILYAKGKYEDGNFSPNQSYLYITIIYTISYSMALYALALFYAACRDLLRPYNPVPKFIIIKSVVFLTYWQGVLVFLAAKSRFIKNTEKAADLQNYVLCVEMLIAAIGHLFAFPYKEYAGPNARPSGGFRESLIHALKFNDFYHDTVHQFAPTYNEYVLYNHNEGENTQAKYPSASAVPSSRDVELAGITVVPVTSSVSSNQVDQDESMTTPIRHKVDPPGGMYDLSDLLDVDLSSYPAKVPAISDKVWKTGPEDVLVKVKYCGICHTDIHQAKNHFGFSKYPMVPGHEVVGVVEEVGPEVSKYTVGDVVGVGGIVGCCRNCRPCNANDEQYCSKKIWTYNDVYTDGRPTQGGFSSAMVVDQKFVVKIPAGLAPEQAAPLLCAGVTAYSPLKHFGLMAPGLRGGILGLGGIGHLGVKLAKDMGHHVTVISSSDKKRAEAMDELGADAYVVSSDGDQMAAAADSLDYIIDTVPVDHPLEPYLALLQLNGKLVLMGVTPAPLSFLSHLVMMGRKTITGSFIGSMQEMEEVLHFFADKGLTSQIEVVKMDYVSQALERLERNNVRYRFVVDVAGSNVENAV